MTKDQRIASLLRRIAALTRQIEQLNTENLRLLARLDIAQTGRRRP